MIIRFFFQREEMFRLSSRRLYKLSDAKVDQYLMHLFPMANQEVSPVADVVPTANQSLTDVAAFHRILLQKMKKLGHHPVGIKVVPPNAAGNLSLLQPTAICAPIFSCHLAKNESSFPLKKIQTTELAVGIVLKERPRVPRMLNRSHCGTMFPAIELCTSRFPLFPPHAIGYAADLCSLAHVVKGTEKPIPPDMQNHGCVLVREMEPLKVGYPKNCMGSPDAALEEAGAYADSIGMDLAPGVFILLTGLKTRVPAKEGRHEAQMGPLGIAKCTLTL